MSFVFGGKLLGQDGPVVDTSGLEKLSKNEKLLLVELERTRMNIAQELSILKQCKGGDTSALDDAILAYSEQRRKDLYATKNDPGNFYDTSRKTIRGKSNQSRTAMQARGRAGIGGTSVLSMTAPGGAPIRTALDTLPVFASMRPVKESTGRDYGKSKTLPFRMPVFALPPIALAVQQDGTIKAAAASSDVSRISFSGGTITKSESSVWPDAAPDRPGSGLNGKGMTNSEALACEIFLMFTSQNIGDVNRLLNIGMDPFARGKALKGRPELMSMTSFAAVREQVLPQPLPKSKSDIGFKTQSSSNAIRQKIERSSTIGHMQQNPSTIFGGTLGSTDDVSTFGGSTYTPGASADPFDGGKTVRSSMGPRKSKLGLIGAGKKKGGRLAPVMTVDGMPNRNCGADDLRKELMNSLASMQKYTVMVKEDILSVNDVVDVRNPKAKSMMLAVAAERMRNILRVVILRELARGLKAWQLSVSQLRSVEKLKIFLRFRNIRNFASKVVRCAMRFLKRKFRHWKNIARAEALRLKAEREKAAAVEIQRVFRGWLGRRRVTDMEDAKKYAAMYRATVKLQAIFRCKGKRWKYLRYLRDKNHMAATITIQRVSRGFLGRKKFRRIRLQANRDIAATMIQSLVRGITGRKKAKQKQHLRNCIKSAVLIQAQMRGFLTRRMVDRILEEKMRDWGLRFIQRIFRGVLCRMNMHRKRREIEEYRRHRWRMAVPIQATFRGFRGRVMARAHIVQKRRKLIKLANAANKINQMVRAFNARAELKNRKNERLKKWVADASRLKETWSDDAQAWFYLDEETGDATWEPSALGYTRADGQLVLANGTTVDYYNVQNGGEIVDVDKVRLQNCIECAYRTAIRACNECGDVFCTKCYNETHAIGGRRTHTYEPVGPIDCSECEEVLAERWCVACDEAYCDDCWRKVHNHGKRRAHPFSKVTPSGVIAPTMFTIDGEQVHEYTSVHAQHQHHLEQDSATMASAENSTVAYDASGYYSLDGSHATADYGAEQGYYDESGNYIYYENSQYDTTQYDGYS